MIVMSVLGLTGFVLLAVHILSTRREVGGSIPWPLMVVALVFMFILLMVSFINVVSGGALFSPPPCPTYEEVSGPLYRRK